MSDSNKVVLAVCSDLHFSHTPPVWRSPEPDWYAAQARPLAQLEAILKEHSCPVAYAGDVLHRWDARPELVNFLLDRLPGGYAVPGQHDLPNHDYDARHRSAYGTLVRSGLLKDVRAGDPVALDGVVIHGFPWGKPVRPCPFTDGTWGIHVALCHRYVWAVGKAHPGAAPGDCAEALGPALRGYAAAFFGDNHSHFVKDLGDTLLVNCGSLQRLTADQKDHRPAVWLLYATGTVMPVFLDTASDNTLDGPPAGGAVRGTAAGGFLASLGELADGDPALAFDFPQAVRRRIRRKGVARGAAAAALDALEKGERV